MAFRHEDLQGQRYELSERPPRDAGSWFLAAAVFVISLLFGLTLLNGLIDQTDAPQTSRITDEEATTPLTSVTTTQSTTSD
ncbi:hypothetical protein [Aliiroseovarius sp. YM-037]|uniref:hypothetical protein n=1 Tax=Aliiroseovarius sp. YM-037 TaxID=3341728 RepID=UPI003A7F9D9A